METADPESAHITITPTPSTRPASPLPFCPTINSPDGDVILCSKDGVEFQIDSLLLRKASPLLNVMLGLPQSNTSTTNMPVVHMEENAEELDFILRYIYPIEDIPPPNSLDHVFQILRVAEKLEMRRVSLAIGLHLLIMLPTEDPVRIWIAGVRYDLQNVRRTAAQFIVRGNIPLFSDDARAPIKDYHLIDSFELAVLHGHQLHLSLRAKGILFRRSASDACRLCGYSVMDAFDVKMLKQQSLFSDACFAAPTLEGIIALNPCSLCRPNFSKYQAIYTSRQQEIRDLLQKVTCVLPFQTTHTATSLNNFSCVGGVEMQMLSRMFCLHSGLVEPLYLHPISIVCMKTIRFFPVKSWICIA